MHKFNKIRLKNSQASSMCPSFKLNRSSSSETILKQDFKCKIPNLFFNKTVMIEIYFIIFIHCCFVVAILLI